MLNYTLRGQIIFTLVFCKIDNQARKMVKLQHQVLHKLYNLSFYVLRYTQQLLRGWTQISVKQKRRS